MSAHPLRSPLPPHLLSAKASATSQGSGLSATANSTPAISRSSLEARSSKGSKTSVNSDYASEKATVALIRRWLCQSASHGDASTLQKPIGELLPPLTSSNEVDLQLYAIIAVIIKDFVYAWYSKITPDHVFVDEVVQIIAHCTRALEQRLRRVDISELVLDEVPALIESHVEACRIALASSATSPYDVEPRRLYHYLNAHPAMKPVPDGEPESAIRQAENETTYRQLLIHGTLAVLLPTEDLENVCLRTLVADVIADLIMGQAVGNKACQPWFIWEAMMKVVEAAKARIEPKATGEEIQVNTKHQLERFGLLYSKEEASWHDSSTARQSRVSALFWRILQYCYLTYLFLRFIILGLNHARSTGSGPPSLASLRTNSTSPVQSRTNGLLTPSSSWSGASWPLRRPILEYRLFSMTARLLDLSTRMPWLLGSLLWCQHTIVSGAGRVGDTDGLLDRFLRTTIQTRFFPPTLLPPLLHQVRILVFPKNSLGPPAPPPPSPSEQLLIRRKCAEGILSLIPVSVAIRFFSPMNVATAGTDELDPNDHEMRTGEEEVKEDMIKQIEEGILDLFADEYMNKHLIYGIIDLIVLKLVPELTEETPSKILGERCGRDEGDL